MTAGPHPLPTYDTALPSPDFWARLAAPIDRAEIAWRMDSAPKQFDGNAEWMARFVAYIEAPTIRERLDELCPGRWSLDMRALPPMAILEADRREPAPYAMLVSLTVLGIPRSDVGQGKDYKQAATDGFKRAATRFGIAHELYSMQKLWVPVTSSDKFKARPKEDPSALYERKYGKNNHSAQPARPAATQTSDRQPADQKGQTSSAPAQQASGNGGKASEKQLKMIYARAKGRRMSDDELWDIYKTIGGVNQSKDLPYGKVDAILKGIADFVPKQDATRAADDDEELDR